MRRVWNLTTFIVLAFCFHVESASILWDAVDFENKGSEYHLNWTAYPERGFWLNVWCDVASSPMGVDWRISPVGAYMEFVGTVYEAEEGDIVNNGAVQQADPVFAVHDENGEIPQTWTPLSGTVPGARFLAFSLVDFYGNEIFGWLRLEVVGVEDGCFVRVGASAIDMDGGGMIVGGGSAIPEPSGALLMLVGGSLLALRRRRKVA